METNEDELSSEFVVLEKVELIFKLFSRKYFVRLNLISLVFVTTELKFSSYSGLIAE